MVPQPEYERPSRRRARLQVMAGNSAAYPNILPGAAGHVSDFSSDLLLVLTVESVFEGEGSWVRRKAHCRMEPKDPTW